MAIPSTGAMPTLQEAFTRHQAVLQGNLTLWQRMEHEHTSDPNIKLLVSRGCQDTLAMITTCRELESKLFETTKASSPTTKSKRQSSEPDSSPTSAKRRRVNGDAENTRIPAVAGQTAPVVDVSGLFMIDPNPADVSTLLSQKQTDPATQPQKKRRRRSERQDDGDAVPQAVVDELGPRNKRRRAATASTRSTENPEPGSEAVDQAQDGPVDENEAHQQSFEAKVALRLKEKEEQRKKKATKKRKRSSEVSTAVDESEYAADEDGNAEASRKIRKPRAKKAKGNAVDEEDTGTNSKKKRSRRRSNSK